MDKNVIISCTDSFCVVQKKSNGIKTHLSTAPDDTASPVDGRRLATKSFGALTELRHLNNMLSAAAVN